MRGLEPTVRDILDRRLQPAHSRPLAVALSGGGDSVALTLIADAWAREHGRELLVLSVDHGLQPQSRAWTGACAATAARLGRPFRALAWTGDKPATGLPAAAREARHRLIAAAAREAGAEVVLLGHTADDVAEARAMRATGSSTPDPRAWAPSPAWPEGRGVFLLRPLLGVTRADLRAWLEARGETWIEDPANADARFARSRARAAGAAPAETAAEPPALGLARAFEDIGGALRAPRAALRAAAPAEAAKVLAMAAVCAGGGARAPAADRAARATDAVRADEDVALSLAGARIEARGDLLLVAREAGEARRGGLPGLGLPEGRPVVWDGRFELLASRPGLRVRRLAGVASRLPADQRRRLAALPAAARGGLPAIQDGETVDCPLLQDSPEVVARSLVGARLAAASGLVDRERA